MCVACFFVFVSVNLRSGHISFHFCIFLFGSEQHGWTNVSIVSFSAIFCFAQRKGELIVVCFILCMASSTFSLLSQNTFSLLFWP